jgi:hypothetical protein
MSLELFTKRATAKAYRIETVLLSKPARPGNNPHQYHRDLDEASGGAFALRNAVPGAPEEANNDQDGVSDGCRQQG